MTNFLTSHESILFVTYPIPTGFRETYCAPILSRKNRTEKREKEINSQKRCLKFKIWRTPLRKLGYSWNLKSAREKRGQFLKFS
ncbi:hypothetical protein OAS18_06535, partial [Nitrospinaceae bacterium]|nr:hypothetical protein [Nitrospinaceae bacterium]